MIKIAQKLDTNGELKDRINFGWLPDQPDQRDHYLYNVAPASPMGLMGAPAPLPPAIDLTNRAEWPAVYDQGYIGSCVAQCLAAAIQYEQIKRITANGKFVGNSAFLSQQLMFQPSRLFAYYEARKIIGLEKADSGCYIRDAMKVAYNVGIPRETGWQYVESKFALKPPKRQYNSAPYHKVTSYARVVTVAEIKKAIAEDFPVTVGISVYDSFFDAANGNIPLPKPREYNYGGHAILLVGYDDATGRFKFRNSWGAEWGNAGYGTIPYSYIGNSGLASDFWVIADSQYKERM